MYSWRTSPPCGGAQWFRHVTAAIELWKIMWNMCEDLTWAAEWMDLLRSYNVLGLQRMCVCPHQTYVPISVSAPGDRGHGHDYGTQPPDGLAALNGCRHTNKRWVILCVCGVSLCCSEWKEFNYANTFLWSGRLIQLLISPRRLPQFNHRHFEQRLSFIQTPVSALTDRLRHITPAISQQHPRFSAIIT